MAIEQEKTTVTVSVGDSIHTVETKPLTLICHQGDVDPQPLDSDVVVIDPTHTIARAASISQAEWFALLGSDIFMELWREIWKDSPVPQVLSSSSLAYRHTVGLLVLIFETCHAGKRPFIKLPETYLHPKQQVGIAQVLIRLTKGN